MDAITNLIIHKLLKEELITPSMEEFYSYGVRLFVMSSIGGFMIMCWGILFKIPFIASVFYITYKFTRKYYNGFHAKTRKRCLLYSSMTIGITFMVARAIIDYRVLKQNFVFIFVILMLCMFLSKSLETIVAKSPKVCLEYYHYLKVLMINIVVFQISYVNGYYAVMIGVLLANACTYIFYLMRILSEIPRKRKQQRLCCN